MSLVKKWLNDETPEEADVFKHCKEMEYVCYAVNRVMLDAETKWKGCDVNHSNMSFTNRNYIIGLVNIQVLDQTIDYLSKLVRSFYKLNPKLARLKKDDPLLLSKHDHTFDKLCSKRFILLQSTYGLIMTILNNCLHREDTRKMMESCLSLISIYNQLIGLSYKTFASKFNVCSNTYPTIISETKTITLTKMVQVLSKSRVEINCYRLINCLVKIYQPENSDNEVGSNTSDSLEIYHTLTKHITPPTSSAPRQLTLEKKREAFVENKKSKMKQCKSMIDIKSDQNKKFTDITEGRNSDSDIPYTSLLTTDCVVENIYNSGESVNGILQSEELYIEVLLDTVANMAPDMLGANGIKKLKSGGVQATKRAARKVIEYYQSVLWGDVGSCLEHIVLWWSTCPLANRSPNTSQNLREWLMTFNVNNTPELVLSAMRILADALGCHVTSTSWDNLFAATAVTDLRTASIRHHLDLFVHVTDCTVTGANFALMLQQLVTLNNQCEVTGEYILGAPLEDLPIVEQIPILHRLDHSVHTYRLWCLSQTRTLAGAWLMDDLFRITHHDMPACMDQLLSLRFADHSHTIETGKIGVHENVCAKMREKLVSEVKVNIQKLKEASEEITSVLSSVCGTTSLAHLTMIFPSAAEWRQITNPPDSSHSVYVYEFLDMMLLPVIKATDDVTALNMVLRIMCEAWLHHIYVARVKFSKDAAVQLLSDFNEVRNWLVACECLGHSARKLMLHNEVLRRCEGVGRLLLHAPGDLISMHDSTAQLPPHARTENTETPDQLMPAEMYVPNQKQWLTLRLKGPFVFSLCCIVLG